MALAPCMYESQGRNGLAVNEVYTSELIRKYKPDPEFYQYILRKEKSNKEYQGYFGIVKKYTYLICVVNSDTVRKY